MSVALDERWEAAAAVPADPGFGLYVHWPFCRSKCPYCDFNSHVRQGVDEARWQRALLRELDHYGGLTQGRRLTSMFFGGGTPSLMGPQTVGAIIERAARHWRLDDDIEITLEANPTSAEAGNFRGYRAAGVNRLSLGLQALNDEALKGLGRTHGVAEALGALALARSIFPRGSFDLIYARPGQGLAGWREELARAIGLGPSHLSLYQLTIEPNTAFAGAARRGELALPDEDTAAALFEATQEMTEAAGLPRYEVSNHARPGEECRHNLTYWRYGEYVGIGPGAHGRLTLAGAPVATRQHRAPEAWLAQVEAAGHATRARMALGPEERLSELVMMGLRLGEGVSEARCRAVTGKGIGEALPRERLARLEAGGFLLRDELGLRATAAGLMRLDAVLAALLA